jgi:hypothetical protein
MKTKMAEGRGQVAAGFYPPARWRCFMLHAAFLVSAK